MRRAVPIISTTALLAGLLAASSLTPPAAADTARAQHVLLISVDGLHAADLARFVADHPQSAMASLSRSGVTYSQARTPVPSDSFPGLLALITGGTPRSTGVYYDVSYDRKLAAPGSDCSKPGTEVDYDESLDVAPDKLDAGGGINPAKLPRDPAAGCAPVFPHSYLRVNTVFDVVKAHGGTTAWADKHPAYDLVRGPKGDGLDDLYTPEIEANMEDQPDGITSSIAGTEKYDDLKVQAILNEIGGKDHAGAKAVTVPTLFGMNFQSVSVAQKIEGYTDAAGTPAPGLEQALEHVDGALQQIIAALKQQGLDGSTAIVLTAKHGQSPIDPKLRRIVDGKFIPKLIEGVAPGLLGAMDSDDVGLIWLTDRSKTGAVVAALEAHRSEAGIHKVYSGAALAKMFADPAKDSRAPDIVIEPEHGVIYTKPTAKKKAEHGGFAADDRNVALLVAGPGLKAAKVTEHVGTQQVAPTILRLLGEPADALAGATAEKTRPLPGL
jgi:hypothetical protein